MLNGIYVMDPSRFDGVYGPDERAAIESHLRIRTWPEALAANGAGWAAPWRTSWPDTSPANRSTTRSPRPRWRGSHEISDDEAGVPSGPGLGIGVDEDLVRELAKTSG